MLILDYCWVFVAGNPEKVKHLLELPKAGTHLSLWRADLKEEGSFDDAIRGCIGVFHVASPMDLWTQDAQVFLFFFIQNKCVWGKDRGPLFMKGALIGTENSTSLCTIGPLKFKLAKRHLNLMQPMGNEFFPDRPYPWELGK